MFKLRTPCSNCPFRKDKADLFRLHPDRIREIAAAEAFQCHKTVVYGVDEDTGEETHDQGKHPQQCAGLMAMLHTAGIPNTIMQVASRISEFDPNMLDTTMTFSSVEEAVRAHNPGHRGAVARSGEDHDE